MKKQLSKKNMNGEPQAQRIQFDYTFPAAEAVCIAGTFNDWRPNATPMIALGAGRWAKELLLPPGTYEYLLVVDGQWIPDPQASDRAPNPFGGSNSVLRVAAPPEVRAGQARLAPALEAAPAVK